MPHRHIDILRYVFMIGRWFENWTNRNIIRLKLTKNKHIFNLQDMLTKVNIIRSVLWEVL